MAALQNKIAYLTGASRGIGEGLKNCLTSAGFHVVGLNRTVQKAEEDFTPVKLDLNDIESVQNFSFSKEADQVLLINNAGLIGEIAPIGSVTSQTIQEVMTVNTIAPQILMNRFIQTYTGKVQHAHILNISSGAGKYPIDAWASYCASKAALDLFSETIRSEFDLRDRANWYIHSIAPGVVDTAMQKTIRNSNPELFKSHEKFISLKANDELSNALDVAKKIMLVIESPQKFENTIISVRDF